MAKPPVKAQQLADRLADRIRSGELPAGEWLPAERQLAEAEVAARTTVRLALQVLAESGLIEIVPGSGARVRTVVSPGSVSTVDVLAELRAVQVELRRLSEAVERQAPSASDPF